MLARGKYALALAVAIGMAVSLAGCASGSGRVHVGFTGGGDCGSVRAELKKLDAMGVPGQIQASQAGQKVSADTRTRINRYNALLNEYLGNECHVA